MPTCCRVLVADDNHDFANSLVELLQAMGHEARAAYDGMEAVDICLSWHPDLAILDVQMPRMNGCAAARLMRAGAEPPHVIASITGMSPRDEPFRSGSHVFDVELSKPPRAREIEELLGRIPCDRQGGR